MSVLYCAECGQEISATNKKCPKCGARVRLWNDIRRDVEKNRIRLVAVVIGALLLVGFGWFLRMDAGYKAPLYVILVIVAPVVPWLLGLAYKSAAPPAEESAPSPKGETNDASSGPTIKLYGPGMGPDDASIKTQSADKGRK